ncbi:MAG: hypothetical protein PVG27_04015 [Chloroflexota bacterium]|jgi:hypothetical protein
MSTPDSGGRPVPRLPQITTRDLNGVRRTLPNGQLSILLIAYQRWQQLEVDTWIPALRAIERRHDEVSYFELPVVGEMNALGRRSLDFWMRRGIPDRHARSRTLTFYVDASGFREPLGIPDEEHVAIVLVDVDGLVLWRGSGAHTPGAERSLRAAIRDATSRQVH